MIHRVCTGLVLFALAAGGCSQKSGYSPVFELGGTVPEMPDRPTIRVLEPKDGDVIRAKELGQIDCKVEVTIPDGGTLPRNLGVYFTPIPGERRTRRKQDKVQGGGRLLPESSNGNTYAFQYKVRVPSASGEYQLLAQADYLVVPESGDKNHQSVSSDDLKPVIFTENCATIRFDLYK